MFNLILDEARVTGSVSIANGSKPEMDDNLFQQLIRRCGTGLLVVSTTETFTEKDGID
jgi:hypothetical protein